MNLPPGVARACVVLFCIEPAQVPEFLSRLQPHQLKSIFKERVMFAHPDRAAPLGVDSRVLKHRFNLLRQAHETLSRYLSDPEESARRLERDYWNDDVPANSMRLGEYLYFTGWLPWSSVAAGLSEHKRRPSFGATAVSLGFCGKVGVEQIELRRLSQERLGDAAVRLKMLTSKQRDQVVAEQQRRTVRLGECLTRLGLMLPGELASMLSAQNAHNTHCRDPFARWAA
ncbi:MAG: hypothetical protein A2289_21215 [Deltaproteobacteria bacterium RIFOXYA12_FULL_58_15]|nr:MAG: hypothetical protein A2289_21215 [Deltaproteobacteria bacterium RIFOXYA12_FULL_58_15]OGR08725.1 MAG: hypothetical protein A2341_00825 [Deltaproteobacteria bacterium RIFOXYB12_FULL_58_9]